jgi:hypothetical protein
MVNAAFVCSTKLLGAHQYPVYKQARAGRPRGYRNRITIRHTPLVPTPRVCPLLQAPLSPFILRQGKLTRTLDRQELRDKYVSGARQTDPTAKSQFMRAILSRSAQQLASAAAAAGGEGGTAQIDPGAIRWEHPPAADIVAQQGAESLGSDLKDGVPYRTSSTEGGLAGGMGALQI